LGRVATEPNTSESEGAPRGRRQPSAAAPEASSFDARDVTASMLVQSSQTPHSLIANNLQLQSEKASLHLHAALKT
jgi:hypothetical protein